MAARSASWPTCPPTTRARIVRETVAAFGSVDIAISNVALRPKQAFLDISLADWDRVVATNLSAACAERDPAQAGAPLGPLSREFGPDGIIANTVAPGAIDTVRDWTQYAHQDRPRIEAEIPRGRSGRVSDFV